MSRRWQSRRWAIPGCAGLVVLATGWFGCGLVPQTLPPQGGDSTSNPSSDDAGSGSGGGGTTTGSASGGLFSTADASTPETTAGDGGGGESTLKAGDAESVPSGEDAARDGTTENADAESSFPDAGDGATVEGGCAGDTGDSGGPCPGDGDAAPTDSSPSDALAD
jgi:hypothetical protein